MVALAPRWGRERAATRPPPPLLPAPTRHKIDGCFKPLRQARVSAATTLPAFSISVLTGVPRRTHSRSIFLICSALTIFMVCLCSLRCIECSNKRDYGQERDILGSELES